MSPELQKKLFEKYPKIFAQKDLDKTQTLMCWGIDCRDGWYWLLDQLCSCIQGYCDSNPHLTDQIEATQVKEKFGTLRFYTNISENTIDGMIWFAEYLSGDICETCGSTEDVTKTSGWVRSVCKKCLEKENETNR